jgi:hypothetical protein
MSTKSRTPAAPRAFSSSVPLAGSRIVAATRQPNLAKATVNSSPNPLEHPVINATGPNDDDGVLLKLAIAGFSFSDRSATISAHHYGVAAGERRRVPASSRLQPSVTNACEWVLISGATNAEPSARIDMTPVAAVASSADRSPERIPNSMSSANRSGNLRSSRISLSSGCRRGSSLATEAKSACSGSSSRVWCVTSRRAWTLLTNVSHESIAARILA